MGIKLSGRLNGLHTTGVGAGQRTPVLAAGLEAGPYDLGTRSTFGDLGRTVADLLGVDANGLVGTSFAQDLGIG